ncbi:hypothetical protein Pla52o_16300 [Novipirellula galeiformis]|uniref:Porin subfamily protein n=1 Tax=Novipirellula galeiformis TaxID=2528004 RepID=A0A5C6CPL1_9BACT|nr:hypothetical protein [Novipirellula galeiformis]TWU25331.1 hypothetical protein Pla52o_16300 [Novipirellula galeiformis]
MLQISWLEKRVFACLLSVVMSTSAWTDDRFCDDALPIRSALTTRSLDPHFPRLLMVPATPTYDYGESAIDFAPGLAYGSGFADVSAAHLSAATYVARGKPELTLLPAPNDANDLFSSHIGYAHPRLGPGTQPYVYGLFVGEDADHDLWTRFKVLPSFGLFYDTGFVGTSFDVAQIDLGKSQKSGQTKFTGSEEDLIPVPFSLLLDNQLMEAFGLDDQVQIYVEANNHEVQDQVRLAHLYVRAWNLNRFSIGAGKSYSLFGVGGALPATIAQTGRLVGTGERDDSAKPGQLRMQRSALPNDFGWGIAVEDPFGDDFDIPANAARLTRWPTFTGNVVYLGEDELDSLQLSGIVRSLGFEASDGVEHFDTAWGLSAYGFLGSQVDNDSVQGFYLGVAAGSGLGDYVAGIEKSAVFDGAGLTTLDSLGSYVGFKRQWVGANDIEYGVNAAYGYSGLESRTEMPDETNQILKQAWLNFLIFPSQNVAVGLEYQFGRRETIDDQHGENHRILAMVALTTTAQGGGQRRNSATYAPLDSTYADSESTWTPPRTTGPTAAARQRW